MQDYKKIKLTDLIDIEFLQEFQDFFAKTMGVASIAVDENGPITKPSNFTPFCNKYTRGSEEGYRRCNDCDIRWGKFAAKTGKPAIYTCHSGLTDFAVPIMIGGKHVASILGGQVLTEPPNEAHFRELARELGINEDEYIDAVKQIKIVPAATVDAAANFLYLVANAISKIAYKNFELVKKSERESIYRNIMDTIRNSIDISETKQIIVDIIGKTLDADRCFIVEYDKMNDIFLIVQDEYVSSEDIPKYEGANVNDDVPNFMEEFKKGNYLVVDNGQIFINDQPKDFDIEKETIEKVKVNSAYGFPLYYNNELLGVLGLHYIKKHQINQDEISLLSIIANQIATALYQAKLYKLKLVDAKRESLLRNIIETIRSSLDIEETLSFICEETAKLFDVQRTAITVFPCPENFEEFIIRKEYKSDPEFSGFTQTGDFSKIASYWGNMLIKSGEVLAFDDIKESDAPDYFKNFYEAIGIKSIIGVPIRKGKNVWGTLVLSEYNNYRYWTNEEKTLLKTISNQVYIAINQAELYDQEQKQSKREQFGRSIIEILRNTIDKNIVKHLFIRSITKHFNADRVFFADFDSKNGIYLPIDENSEFLSNPKEKSFVNQSWSVYSMSEYIQPLLEKRELKIQCWDEYVKKNVISKDFKSRFEDANVKSSYNFPVLYEGAIMGFFCIEFTHEGCRKLSDEDIGSIRNICTQAGIALYHSELYRKEKETAERERILREVINKIRSSLDIEDIKYEIVNQIGILFKADRVCIAYYDKNLKTYTISEKGEYRSYGCEKSFIGVRFDNIEGFSEYIRDSHLRGEDIIFSDLETHLDNNNLRGTGVEKFYREFGFTSSMALNIVYGDIFLGDLVITFEQKRNFSEDEINFIRTIADQAGTAFYQAELLEKEKKTVVRESLLRKVIAVIRDSLDINEIKKNVVGEIGKAFNADRCYFRYYDKKHDKFLKPDVEYLGSDEIPTLLNVTPDQEGLAYFIDELNKRKRGFYPIVADEEFARGTQLESYFKSSGLKADYAMPILDREDELTYLVLHYTQVDPQLTDEDKSFLEAIANQIVIAFDQAKLYEKQKEIAAVEKILREIISEIKITQNIDEAYNYLIAKLVNIFDASGVIFIKLPDIIYEKASIKYECIRNNELPTFLDTELPDVCSDMFFELVKSPVPFIVEDTKTLHVGNEIAQKFCDNHFVKSFMAVPLMESNDHKKAMGILLICSSELRIWSQKEIDLLSAITNSAVTIIQEIVKVNTIEELINTFISTLSTCIQTPLKNQEKTLEFLSFQKSSKSIGDFKAIIDEASRSNKNLFELLTKLLDSYNYESGKRQLNLEYCNVNEIINSAKNKLQDAANLKGITIHVTTDENIPEIEMDKEEIEKVIYSLLDNVINYTQNNAIIEIKSYTVGKDIVICLSDNGPGILPEIKEKIFKRYDATRMTEAEVSRGIGLYLSKLIAESHDGKLWCESEVGVGTIVCLLLPIHKE